MNCRCGPNLVDMVSLDVCFFSLCWTIVDQKICFSIPLDSGTATPRGTSICLRVSKTKFATCPRLTQEESPVGHSWPSKNRRVARVVVLVCFWMGGFFFLQLCLHDVL